MNNNFNFELEPGRDLNKYEYKNYKTVISIITPTYNINEYIMQTANCLLNQTYPYFEWLIIDDGSKSRVSLEILDNLEKMDSRIKVYHKDNEGPAKARDFGVSKCSKDSEYVVFIDDDDLLDKTFLEIAYYSLSCNKGASWCYSDVVNFQGQQTLWNKQFSSEVMKNQNILTNQAMIRKSALIDVGGFSLEGRGLYEDWILWLKLLAKGHYPVHMSYYGFWYRKKASNSQLSDAMEKHDSNMEMVLEYAEKVQNVITPIEYPRSNYDWGIINPVNDNVVVPEIVKTNKKNILIIVPWMVLGGADKFNLDLIRLIDKEKYSFTMISMQPTPYTWRQQFEEVCESVYDLSTFIDQKDWMSFVNYIVKVKNIDIILNTNSTTGYMMLPFLKANYPDIPIMDYIHMEEWYNRNGGYSRDSAAVTSVIDKTLFCNKNSEKILNEYFKVDANKADTVYIGVDAEKFDPNNYNVKQLKNKYEIPNDKFVMSLIARIDYQKRPFLMMRILEELVKTNKIPNLLFVVAGDGPLLEQIKNIAVEKNLNNYIKFLGVTNTPDEIYAISDVTLNCSIKEGLALTAYESLSMGVPVVSCDVGGQKELINEKVGVIVPCLQDENDIYDFNYSNEDVLNYVNGIIKVYENVDKYKKECRKRILNGFTIQNMAENMDKEFEKLLKIKNISKCSVTNIDVYMELLNQYFLANKGLYDWLCADYNNKVYISNRIGLKDKLRKNKFIRKAYSVMKNVLNK